LVSVLVLSRRPPVPLGRRTLGRPAAAAIYTPLAARAVSDLFYLVQVLPFPLAAGPFSSPTPVPPQPRLPSTKQATPTKQAKQLSNQSAFASVRWFLELIDRGTTRCLRRRGSRGGRCSAA